ncbi:hypothetical protein OIU77_013619 [Salix suchowensis]|uniref:Protein kinase domain-containing protein n=1 Tax=Salix suchowensis TaxID=1278906 RepID=A0ABQ8ZUQ1_9ROSI|nr:hypothetical protein OIU77_013619 [Salix suchowensis]
MAGPETETGLAVPDVEVVLDFLRKNGLKDAELALKEDMTERNNELGSFDFEKFLFVLPPVRIPSNGRQLEVDEFGGGGERLELSSGSPSADEFVSLGSSTAASGVYSSACKIPPSVYSQQLNEFSNPYGLHSASQANSETSSDRLSQFGTARDYCDFDMQDDFCWCDEKEEGYFMTPCLNGADYFSCPSEDKFVMTSETEKQFENSLGLYDKSEGGTYSKDPVDCIYLSSEVTDLSDFQLKGGESLADYDIAHVHMGNKNANYYCKKGLNSDLIEGFKSTSDIIENVIDDFQVGDGGEVNGEAHELEAAIGGEDVNSDELLRCYNQEDEYEVFNLRVIHRKNRTGFEENKDLPIVLNTVIAGRYYVTEYLGSAAFSKVIQAHDLHTGIDVCLKIIKNDKDFFDQSLDEIKLLKIVNKHDPADERHILRLYDYFYHQEHLFIVCELLKANLYEFQKFSQESGGKAYFTLSRLQVITCQCLEALEYLHHLGIIHCDLKPENILMKSYRRCEIKVIDLGSSCFKSDNLCLYVQSRSYRAPEVILGLPYDQKIDLWSLGCILAELCSGEVLFPNDAVVMILARMIGMLGPIHSEMLMKGQETHKYFTEEYDLYYSNEETNQIEYVFPEESSLEHHLKISDVRFIDFMRNLLELNPLRRLTAKEALEHPWLSHSY